MHYSLKINLIKLLIELVNWVFHIFQDLFWELFKFWVATFESFELFDTLMKHLKRSAELVFSLAQRCLGVQDLVIQIVEILVQLFSIDIFTPLKSLYNSFVIREWRIHVIDFFFLVTFPLIEILGKLPNLLKKPILKILQILSETLLFHLVVTAE
jgi:hypothetical protein